MMRRNRKHKLIGALILACLVLLCPLAKAQEQNKFRYKTDVAKSNSGKALEVDSTGVYRIQLSAKFIAKSVKEKFSDIRLMDESGRFVAYSLLSDIPQQHFFQFPEVKQVTRVDTVTTYIADVVNNESIDQLSVSFKNTDVRRRANLSGSDDLQHWYAIREGIELQGSVDDGKTEYEQTLNFPTSKYRYYRIQVFNGKNDPVKIIKSGVYETVGYIVQVDKVQPISAVAKNGQSKTSYFITFDDYYDLDGIQATVSSAKPYSREVIVYDIGNKKERKVSEWDISSSSPRGGIPCTAKTNKVRIDILNGDDSPLIFKDVVASAPIHYATAYLEKGHKYSLLVNDSTAKEVSYDLTFLHSKRINQFPVIQHSAIYKNPTFGVTISVAAPRNYTPFIWAAIVAVVTALGALTFKMVKEVDKSK